MPKIPTSSRQVFTQPGPTPQVRARLGTTAGTTNIAGQAGQLVDQVANIVNKERARVESIEIDALKTRLRDKQNQLTHDREKGFLNVRGRDTLSRQKEFTDEYDSFIKDELGSITNGRVRQAADGLGAQFRVSLQDQYNRHTSREMDRYDDDQTQANLESIRNHAVLNAGPDPNKVAESIEEQRVQIDDYVTRKGISKERSDQMKLKASSSVHEGVINQALNNGSDQLARDYYTSVKKKGELDANTSEKMERIITEANTTGEAQRMTDDIVSQQLGIGESLRQAREIKDPKVRDATVKRVRNRINEQKFLDDDQKRRNFQAVATEVEAKKTRDQIPVEQWNNLSLTQRNAIDSRIAQLSKGVEPTTDSQLKYNLILEATNPATLSKFKRRNLMENRPKLNNSDFNQLVRIQAGLQAGNKDMEKQTRGIRSNIKIANDSLKKAGISGDTAKARFSEKLDEQVILWKEANNKTFIPQNQVQDLANALLTEVVTDEGFFFDTEKKVFELEPNEAIEGIEFEQIPEVEINYLAEYFRSTHRPFSEEQAVEKYKDRLRRQIK